MPGWVVDSVDSVEKTTGNLQKKPAVSEKDSKSMVLHL